MAILGRRSSPMSFVLATLMRGVQPAIEVRAEVRDSVIIRQLPQSVFADSTISVRLGLNVPQPTAARVVWSLQSLQHRNLARNETSIAAGESAATVTIQFPLVAERVICFVLSQRLRTRTSSNESCECFLVRQRVDATRRSSKQRSRCSIR
jgi:hypothetical protein